MYGPAHPTPFKIVHQAGGGSDEYATLHQRGCFAMKGETRWLNPHEAAVAVSDGVPCCTWCRPDDLLDVRPD